MRENSDIGKGASRELLARENERLRERIAQLERSGPGSDVYQRIAETIPAGLVVADRTGRITYANQWATRVLGISRSEITERAFNAPEWDVTDDEGAPLPEDQLPFRVVQRTHEPVRNLRHAVQWPDGRRVLLSVHAAPLFAEDGSFAGMVAMMEDRTEQEVAAKALADSQAQLQSLIDASPMGIHRYTLTEDDQLVFEGANRAANVLLGIDNGQFVGKRIEDAFPPLAGTEVPDRYRRAAKHGESWNTEQVTYDHEQIQGAFEVHAFQTAPGRMAALFLDITERKRSEVALRRNEERFRMMAENSTDIVWTMTLDGHFTYVSPAVTRVTGLTVEQVLATPLPEYLTPESAQEITSKLFEQLGLPEEERLPAIVVEAKQRAAGGRILDIEVSATWLRDDRDRIVGVQGVTRDITERKKESEEQERLIQLIECSGDFIGLATLGGDVTYVNKAGLALSGLESFASAPRIEHYIPDEDSDWFQSTLLPDLMQTGMATGDGRLKRFDGKPALDVEFRVFLLRDAWGQASQLAVIIRDISARKAAEAERARLEQELQQSQKMEAVGRLAGGIAHDFNNLLTGIGGFAELLEVSLPEGDDLREDAEEIRRAVDRAAELTHQLLAFSRKQVISPVVLDTNEVLGESVRMVRRLLGEDVLFELRPSIEPMLVHMDPGQLQQVLINLATNARDAMPTGGRLTVEVSALELDEMAVGASSNVKPGHFVQIAVSDEGVGMDSRTVARMFEPFFTTKERNRGTGLGLATVYGIVNQAGGFLKVYSELGVGTCFKVYLPRVEGEERRPAPRRRAPSPTGTEHVLLVEDDESLREFAVRALRKLGYEVTVAVSGAEALAMANDDRLEFDLLLTDVVMPGMSGTELLEQLLQNRPALRVLFMSGYAEDHLTLQRMLDKGYPFLAKPFGVAALSESVRDVLDRDSPMLDG